MRGKRNGWSAALVLLLGLFAAGPASAGPYFGEWTPWYCPHDCPPGTYSPLHYWAPRVYRARAWVHPSYLDQYPPGPCPPVPATFQFSRYRCPGVLPAPSAPYANPTGYYGRPVVHDGY